MSGIAAFFKKIGAGLKHIWRGIEKIVPDEQMIAGIEYVEHAAVAFTTNPERIAWVVAQLMQRFPIGENIARIIAEMAVYQVKKLAATGADKLEAEVTKD